MFDLVRAINTARDAGVGGPFFEAAQRMLREFGDILGLRLVGEEMAESYIIKGGSGEKRRVELGREMVV